MFLYTTLLDSVLIKVSFLKLINTFIHNKSEKTFLSVQSVGQWYGLDLDSTQNTEINQLRIKVYFEIDCCFFVSLRTVYDNAVVLKSLSWSNISAIFRKSSEADR